MIQKQAKVTVLGGGSWATALVKLLLENKHDVTWWVRDEQQAKYINKHKQNPKYLSSVHLGLKKGAVITDIKKAISVSDWIIVAVPAAFLPAALTELSAHHFVGKKVVSAVKGMIQGSNQIMAHFFASNFKVKEADFLVISGPCHAEEVAMEKLSYLTLASTNLQAANLLCTILSSPYLIANPSDDVIGSEFGAVMKNIYALASGIAHGLGYGDNFHAVLMSNAIQELEKFINAIHLIHRDVKSSAYLGDLLVTAYSQFSRNRTFGNMIGKGYSVKAAQLEMNMIAEGYYATQCLYELNKKYKVSLPIVETVHKILYQKKNAALEFAVLCKKLS